MMTGSLLILKKAFTFVDHQCLLYELEHYGISGVHADDTVIYFSDTSLGLIMQVLQNDLNYVEQWLQENKIELNWSKTK